MLGKHSTTELPPQLENIYISLPFSLSFLSLFLDTRSHYVAQATHKFTKIFSLCLPQAWQNVSLLSIGSNQYFLIFFSHSKIVLSMNTTQLIFLLGKNEIDNV